MHGRVSVIARPSTFYAPKTPNPAATDFELGEGGTGSPGPCVTQRLAHGKVEEALAIKVRPR